MIALRVLQVGLVVLHRVQDAHQQLRQAGQEIVGAAGLGHA
jgi:hypothetical protein